MKEIASKLWPVEPPQTNKQKNKQTYKRANQHNWQNEISPSNKQPNKRDRSTYLAKISFRQVQTNKQMKSLRERGLGEMDIYDSNMTF